MKLSAQKFAFPRLTLRRALAILGCVIVLGMVALYLAATAFPSIGANGADMLRAVIGDQAVQLGQAGHPDPEASSPEHRSLLIHHRHVVVGLGPVDAHEDHDAPPSRIDSPAPSPRSPRRPNGSVLYRHAIPPAV